MSGLEPNTYDLTPFSNLTPDCVLASVESLGFICDGRLLALNSYENRVWQVGLENDAPIIVKFYRPQRWSDDAIIEEHHFAEELSGHELPIVAPLRLNGQTLHFSQGHRLAVFRRFGGHAPELADKDTLAALGRLMGRIHAVSATQAFQHRTTLSPTQWGQNAIDFLITENWIPPHVSHAFETIVTDLMTEIHHLWNDGHGVSTIRLHGDCHPGNILCRDDQIHFVDLDDCCMGPAIQDLWMWLSGDHAERTQQLGWLVDAYELFFPFNAPEIRLIEALRTLRMIHYQAWIARRWQDPAFKRAFSWFEGDQHWERLIEQLREQLDEIHQPTLVLDRS